MAFRVHCEGIGGGGKEHRDHQSLNFNNADSLAGDDPPLSSMITYLVRNMTNTGGITSLGLEHGAALLLMGQFCGSAVDIPVVALSGGRSIRVQSQGR
jgi:hypothetical protein